MPCVMITEHLARHTTGSHAGVAELADARDLKSRGSNPVPVRPRSPAPYRGVEQLVARRAHNPEVVGSSPTPATIKPSDFESNQTVFSISSSKKLRLVFQPLRLTHTLTHTRQKRGPDTALPRPDLALSQDIFRVRLPAPSPWLSPPLSGRPWSHGRRCPG